MYIRTIIHTFVTLIRGSFYLTWSEMFYYSLHELFQKLRTMLLASLFFASNFIAFSQSTVWYFGQNAGISFNANGIPSAVQTGNMNTPEGCAIIMNSNGTVANYTNGRTLWDGQGTIIANDLFGDMHTTQSAAFVAKPGDLDTTYLFTLDVNVGPNGLCYSVLVNNNIVPNKKNIPIRNNLTERMVVVRHCNMRDAWLIVHGWNNNCFYAYRITAEGIDTVPQISCVGNVQSGNLLNATGYLKASFLGDRLAMANMGAGKVELFHFDNVNGIISNLIELDNLAAAYGVEFSHNGKVLYVSTASGSLYNFSLAVWNQQQIESSRSLISNTGSLLGALQMGPNNRIYVACDQSNFIGRIANPDNLGTNCNYNSDFLHLNGAKCEAGLPPFVNTGSNFIPIVNVACLGDTSFFSFYGDTLQVDSVLWNFGNYSLTDGFSRKLNPHYIYSKSGVYNAQLMIYHCDEVDTLSFQVKVLDFPQIDLGSDTSFCENESIIVDASVAGGATYLWQDGSSQASMKLDKTGTYWVKVKTACGFTTDTIKVLNIWKTPTLHLPNDTSICLGDSLILDAGANAIQYLWQNVDAGRYFIVKDPGLYTLSIIDSNYCKGDGQVFIDIDYPPSSSLGNDTSICRGTQLVLDAGEADHYEWQNFSTGKYLYVSKAGSYSVQMENKCGSLADTIEVRLSDCLHYISIPNAFSPNGDQLNDVFIPKAANISDFEMYIYNRWGHLIFFTNDLNRGWDGKEYGKYVATGIYVYTIKYRDLEGKLLIKKGFINLIR